jgi:hypothetical protein
MIARIDHAAQQVRVEPARYIEITAQMRGPDASGAEFQPHTAAGGVAAKAVEISRLVGLDRRIIADLEQLTPRSAVRSIIWGSVSGLSAVSCHCQKKA